MRDKQIEDLKEYKYGFTTDIENIRAPKGLNEEVIKFISKIKKEPDWMLDWRLKAFERLKNLKEPNWQKPKYPKIDYQDLYYYSAPKSASDKPKSLDELDPKLLETYQKLGIPLQEQKRLNGIAVDAVFDSVSVATTFKDKLTEKGIIFCSMSEAIQKHPELVKKYLGSVIPVTDHYFATLNSAVFTDGSFVYIPEGVRCPMELSTYFRINASETGQFERTLIIADKGSYVSYLEGCTAPMRDENQLHAANVELVALDDAEIKYSTVQNWYPGAKMGKTESGAVWLDKNLLSIYDYWQFWRNTDDRDVIKFLKMFTDLSLEKIEDIKNENINDLKILLANEATKMLHGEIETKKVEELAKSTFKENSTGEHLPSVKIGSDLIGNYQVKEDMQLWHLPILQSLILMNQFL